MFESAPFDATPRPFADLGLDSRLQRAIAELGFTQTTPVQSAVYPAIAAGDDVIACAQTGTGKTVAFLLPVLQRLLAASPRRRRAAIACSSSRRRASWRSRSRTTCAPCGTPASPA